jgi:hypothetical protein
VVVVLTYQTRRSIRVTDIDNSMLLFGKRRACDLLDLTLVVHDLYILHSPARSRVP